MVFVVVVVVFHSRGAIRYRRRLPNPEWELNSPHENGTERDPTRAFPAVETRTKVRAAIKQPASSCGGKMTIHIPSCPGPRQTTQTELAAGAAEQKQTARERDRQTDRQTHITQSLPTGLKRIHYQTQHYRPSKNSRSETTGPWVQYTHMYTHVHVRAHTHAHTHTYTPFHSPISRVP